MVGCQNCWVCGCMGGSLGRAHGQTGGQHCWACQILMPAHSMLSLCCCVVGRDIHRVAAVTQPSLTGHCCALLLYSPVLCRAVLGFTFCVCTGGGRQVCHCVCCYGSQHGDSPLLQAGTGQGLGAAASCLLEAAQTAMVALLVAGCCIIRQCDGLQYSSTAAAATRYIQSILHSDAHLS